MFTGVVLLPIRSFNQGFVVDGEWKWRIGKWRDELEKPFGSELGILADQNGGNFNSD
jgi:hypothetical protein